jgi:ABC-type phosphate/phosphonate transport system substrate-binding protein
VFEERVSGPLEGDEEPFSSGRADIRFLCAPLYRWVRETRRPIELLPLPVPIDARAQGRPVYFADVVVRAQAAAQTFADLRGGIWPYNDRNSRSRWFNMLDRVGESFFAQHIHSGSHLRSLEIVFSGAADAAAIDSNVLRLYPTSELRVLETWGPFAIQPTIVRSSLNPAIKARVANALLTLSERS